MNRRQLLGVIGLGALATLPGGAMAQTLANTEDVQSVAIWRGPLDGTSPPPASNVVAPASLGKTYGVQYFADDGSVWYTDQSINGWKPVSYTNQVVVHDESDLPDPSGGTITLEDGTVYRPNGFVTYSTPIELNTTTPIIGRHGGQDGFIYTGAGSGQGAAVQGTDAALLWRNLYWHAPGATLFDITASTATEMLVESCAFSDAAGLGQIANLGTIDGYRVPSFKGVNFEDFSNGLTLTGSSDKVFFEGCPFRTVTASGVVILTFDANFSADIIDLANNYVKGVQSDTVVIAVDQSATINDIFQYRGNTHDSTITKSNILTGAAGVQQVGYRVSDSYPLDDSAVIGELSLDSPTTTTISAQNTWTPVAGATSLGNETERVSQSSNGVLQYDGQKDVKVHITASITAEGGSNETYAFAIAKNGSVEPTSEARIEGTGNSPVFVAPSSVEDLSTDGTISLQVKNLDGTTDITVDLYNLNFYG